MAGGHASVSSQIVSQDYFLDAMFLYFFAFFLLSLGLRFILQPQDEA